MSRTTTLSVPACGRHTTVDLGAHCRMDDGIEILDRFVITEDQTSELAAVEGTVGGDDVSTEAHRKVLEQRRAGPLQFVDDGVGIDDHRAMARQ